MSNKFDVIFFWKQCDWGFYNRRNEAILWEFNKNNKVNKILHCESISLKGLMIYLYKMVFSTMRSSYALQIKKALRLKPVKIVGEKIYITSIIYISNSDRFGSIVAFLNNFLINYQLKRIKHYFYTNKKKKIMIIYPPARFVDAAMNILEHNMLIADLVDDVVERTDDDKKKQEYERSYINILPLCDYISATGSSLRRYESICNKKIDVIPNGVDIAEFDATESSPFSFASKGPNAVYVGCLNQEMDFELLNYAVLSNPNINFIIYGFCSGIGVNFVEKLSKYKNFKYMGPVHFSKVPTILNASDILLSFKKAGNTVSGGDSIKIYEYLATGKPIVTTSVSPAEKFTNFVFISDDPVVFSNYIEMALQENNPLLALKRKEAAQDNSWECRFSLIWRQIEAHL